MNEAELLPRQYIEARRRSDRQFMYATFPYSQFGRVCTDPQNTCPVKRNTVCQVNHCIKRHPTPEAILKCPE